MKQIDIVEEQLKEYGEVTRNWCLERYISRLGSIICKLKKKGYEFETEYRVSGNSKDYVYKVVTSPKIAPTSPKTAPERMKLPETDTLFQIKQPFNYH